MFMKTKQQESTYIIKQHQLHNRRDKMRTVGLIIKSQPKKDDKSKEKDIKSQPKKDDNDGEVQK